MKFLIPSIAVTGLLITSCASTESFVNDDIYSVRPSELPIGESTSDETSYASFKSRKTGNTNDRMSYADEVALANRQSCLNQWRWYDGCGCSYSEWALYSNYSPNNIYATNLYWRGTNYARFYNYSNSFYSFGGYHPYGGGWGYSAGYMSPYYHSPYMMNDPWMTYYGMGMGFGMGYSPYGGYYGYNPYNPYGYYGYGNGGYGYGGNMNGWGGNHNSGTTSNVIRGPRGTSSGYSNPTGRTASSNTVKSGRASTPASTGKGAPVSVGRPTTVTREVGRDVISRQNSGTSVSRTNTTTGNSRIASPVTTPQRNVSGTSSPSRTVTDYQRSTNPGRSNSSYQNTTYPSRTNSSSGVNSRSQGSVERTNNSGGYERSSSPSQGSMSSPSRSSSGSGSSSSGSSGSSGRSGSSGSSSSPGRR